MEILLNSISSLNWIANAMKTVCAFFDWLIFSVVSGVYTLFVAFASMDMSLINLMTNNIAYRLTLLIGVYMLFSLALSLIKYLADPDRLSDGKVGGEKLMKNVVIALMLLAITMPASGATQGFVFREMKNLQSALFSPAGQGNNNIVAKVVFGGQTADEVSSAEWGDKLAMVLFTAFLYPKDGSSITGKYNTIVSGGDLWGMVDIAGKDDMIYNFPIISGACGIAVIVILFGYALDIGIRNFKLLFLEMIAPIPVMTYINPANQGILKEWIRLYLSMFVDLFIRLFMIYFAVLLVNNVAAISGYALLGFDTKEAATAVYGGFIPFIFKPIVFIVIFSFAKAAPNLIYKIFNIEKNDDAGFAKKVLGAAAGGALALGVGAAMGLGSTAVGVATAGKGNRWAALKGGTWAGLKNTLGSGVKGFNGGMKGGLGGVIGAGWGAGAGAVAGQKAWNKKHAESLENAKKACGNVEDVANAEYAKSNGSLGSLDDYMAGNQYSLATSQSLEGFNAGTLSARDAETYLTDRAVELEARSNNTSLSAAERTEAAAAANAITNANYTDAASIRQAYSDLASFDSSSARRTWEGQRDTWANGAGGNSNANLSAAKTAAREACRQTGGSVKIGRYNDNGDRSSNQTISSFDRAKKGSANRIQSRSAGRYSRRHPNASRNNSTTYSQGTVDGQSGRRL